MFYILEDGWLIQVYDSDNPAYTNPNWCCEGYCLFKPDGTYYEGGEYEFDPEKVTRDSIIINQTINFATDKRQKKYLLKATDDCAYEDIVELFTDEFYQKELFDLQRNKHITNEILKAKIKKAHKILADFNRKRYLDSLEGGMSK